MAEEQKMPETQAGTQPNGQQPAQEAPQPAADAPHSCPEEGPGQETTKEHKEHKPGKEALHAQLAAAQQKAEDLSAQLAQAKDTLMRTAAEYDNFRKRSQKEKDAIYPEAVANTVLAFLPVLDNFERAVAAECKDADFKKGIELIMTAFKDCLTKLKVEEIASLGEEFDPNLHNAVMHIEDDTTADNVIVEVFQKGYLLGERVIRYAMVKVAN